MSQSWGSEPERSEAAAEQAGRSAEWDLARKQIERRRNLVSHAVAYVVVNAFLVVVWVVTGRGYFWPVWVMAGWGVGLLLDVWNTLGTRPVTDADVEAELRRRR